VYRFAVVVDCLWHTAQRHEQLFPGAYLTIDVSFSVSRSSETFLQKRVVSPRPRYSRLWPCRVGIRSTAKSATLTIGETSLPVSRSRIRSEAVYPWCWVVHSPGCTPLVLLCLAILAAPRHEQLTGKLVTKQDATVLFKRVS
jgi:hypothetical protein